MISEVVLQVMDQTEVWMPRDCCAFCALPIAGKSVTYGGFRLHEECHHSMNTDLEEIESMIGDD